jgi:hypothetical protein
VPLSGRTRLDDHLIILLREQHHIRQFERDSDPSCVVPRFLRGGSPLAALQARAPVGRTDVSAHEHEVKRMARRLAKNGDDERTTKDRAALVAAIARQSLPGDPADDFDPMHTLAARQRLQEAPEDVRAVLEALRGVSTPYAPWEAVCEHLADVLAPEGLRAAWKARDPDAPSREVWAGALLEDAIAWWFP